MIGTLKKAIITIVILLVAGSVLAQVPVITGFAPASGPAGTTVTIIGNNFNNTPSNNIVYFGATKASVSTATSTQLTVVVPAGATYEPISVTAGGLTGYSTLPFIFTFPGGAPISTCSLAPKVDFATGASPEEFAIADFDGDGKPDLAIPNLNGNSISLFLNTATPGAINASSFAARVDIITGAFPNHAVAGDLDGDGKLDLAVVNANDNSISVYRNTSTLGSISFAAKVDFASGINSRFIALGDLDGDGKPEMAVPNNFSKVSIFLNSSTVGNISFSPKVDFTTGSNSNSVGIVDLDSDQKPEIATANISGTNTVSILKNISTPGTLAFAAKVDFVTANGPVDLAIGDLDSDTKPDVAVVCVVSGTLTVLRNTSAPGIIDATSFAPKVDFTAVLGAFRVTIGDIDGDGKPEAVTGNNNINRVSLFRNTSTPGIINASSFAARVDFISGNSPTGLGICDFDGDGQPDVAVTSFIPAVSILRNTIPQAHTIASLVPSVGPIGTSVTINGTNFSTTPANNIVRFNGTLASVTASTATSITTTVPAGASSGFVTVTIGCFAATSPSQFIVPVFIASFAPTQGPAGTTVIISGTSFSSTPTNNFVYFGATKAAVTAATTTQLTVKVPTGATYQPISVTVAGLTAYTNNPFVVTFPDGGLINACSFSLPTVYGTGGAGVDLALGDLDGDGKTDIAETNYSNSTVQVFRNTSTTGSIDASSFASSVDFVVGTNPLGVSVADIDGDGKLDIVVTSSSNIISIFRNISTIGSLTAASFSTRVDLATGSQPFHLSCADLDGDGKTDIAVGNQGSGIISIWQNIGAVGSITTGSFAPRLDITGPSAGFTIADMDVDGKPDLIGGYNLGTAIGVSRNISTPGLLTTGSFSAFVNFTTSAWPENIVIGDLDSDNRPEIVNSSWPGNVISVLKNTSTPGSITAGSFATNLDITGNLEPRGVVITDFDGDGVPDIGLANQTGTLSIYKNANTPGSITAASFLPKVNFPGIGNARSVLSGDLDGDGKPDVATANFGSPPLLVLRNTVSSLLPPTITGFVPLTGNIGGTVTISGTNFSATPLNNTVRFNGVIGTVTASTSTSITATVPVGATTGNIQVTVGCNTATSASPFNISCLPLLEHNALVALYNSTNGAGWTDNSNWLSGDESLWAGVLITGCHVTDLLFDNNNLTGPLPPQIGDLTFLTRIEMSGNNLTGNIPSQIGNLSSLDRLNLLDNQLSGSLPTQIGNLSALTSLELSFNQLTGSIPTQIGNLSNLRTLGLSKNQLSGNIPDEFWNLTQLRGARMFQNQLGGILPPEIGNLVNLTDFSIEGNQFFDLIPPEIGNLTQLIHLNLAYNQFSGQIPTEIGNLVLLKDLQFSNNQLDGAIPIEIGNLGVCDVLTLDHNLFTDLPNLTTTPLYILNQNFADITVYDNYLTFEDLEPNKPFPLITLGPQAKVPPGGLAGFIPGSPLFIPFATPGTANTYQWFKDGLPIPGETSADLSIAVTTVANAGFYTVRISNTIVTGVTLESLPYVVYTDLCTPVTPTAGDLDLAYDPPTAFSSAFYNPGIQSDGKIIVMTDFAVINSVVRNGLIRINTDGSEDNTFAVNSAGPAYVIQPNDKIIAANGGGNMVRLETDGTVDPTFANPSYYNAFITALGLQADGKVIVAVNEDGTQHISRLNSNGTNDASFSAIGVPDVNVIRIQSDGYILIGGEFPGGIARLDPTGAIDPGFNGVAGDFVTDIAIQPDGKIIVVGLFSFFNDQPHPGIVRLMPDGNIDFSFAVIGITDLIEDGNYPNKIAIQSDGKIILAGFFTSVNGTNRKHLVRLNIDGSVDCFLDPGTSTFSASDVEGARIVGMVLQADGKIVITGAFEKFRNVQRFGLARVNNILSGSCLPSAERAALVALFTSTNGAGWTNKTNWLNSDESTWFGVTVVGCHVTQIILNNNNLVGTLPVEIGNLPSLSTLDLSFNHLSGSLPGTITNLTALQYLKLDNNVTLTGPLPAAIGNMVALKEIVTQNNAFTGPIPPSMASCVALEKIQLEGNQHTGSVPAYFSTFPNLTSINLGFNQFTGSIPTSWGGITNLSFLSLAENDLTGSIPTEFGSLDNLGTMDLSRNRLSGTIPVELGNMGSIGNLQLWDNQLTGTIPTQLGNAITLQYLGLEMNQLSGSIPTSLGNLVNLIFLELNENQLTGSIPVELGNDVLLQFVRLGTNQLTGSIPTTLGNLPDVFLLDIDHNQLTGSIPTTLGNDTSLKYLNLNVNQLSGSIPIELGNLILLEDLNLYTNQLTGSLPKELGQCIKLKRFGVGDNLLSGALPKEYGSWTDLTDFGIYNNNFTGSIPVEYLAWTKAVFLYFSDNKLDAIPTFSAATITEFNVFDNLFEFGDLEPNIAVTGYNYTPQADLPGGTISLNAGNPLTIPFVTSGTANQYQWHKNGTLIPGATSSTFSIPSATVADAGNYTVNVTNTIVTGLTITTLPFVVTVIPVITITLQPIDVTVCDGVAGIFTTAATGTTNIVYQWQFSPSGPPAFVDISNGPNYSGATTTTLTVNTSGNFGAGRYRCRINGDLAAQVITFDEGLFVNLVPPLPGGSGSSACSGSTVTLSANGGVNGQYRWYTIASGGTAIAGEVNDTYLTPVLTTTTNYFVALNNGSCESARTIVTATLIALPSAPTVTPGTGCAPSSSVTLSASGGVNGQYRWYTVATGGAPIPAQINSGYTTPVLSTSTTYFVSINNGTCESLRTSVLADIKSCVPSIAAASLSTQTGGQASLNIAPLITTINSPLDISSIAIIVPPSSGATASITSGSLLVDYSGITFAGIDQLTIRACDMAAHCAQQVITIDVTGEITIYNAVSPNGDGKNETFFIQSINLLPETRNNKVSIFDRWGDIVFEVDNYDNATRVFRGLNNSGDELPPGTYYYKIDFTSGEKTKTGFLSLRR